MFSLPEVVRRVTWDSIASVRSMDASWPVRFMLRKFNILCFFPCLFSVITAWNRNAIESHVLGGFKYYEGRLCVPENGRYYVYAQVYFNGRQQDNTNRVIVYANNRTLLLIQKTRKESTGFSGGVFQLKEGEKIYVKVVIAGTKLWVGPFHSYFGAYLI